MCPLVLVAFSMKNRIINMAPWALREPALAYLITLCPLGCICLTHWHAFRFFGPALPSCHRFFLYASSLCTECFHSLPRHLFTSSSSNLSSRPFLPGLLRSQLTRPGLLLSPTRPFIFLARHDHSKEN